MPTIVLTYGSTTEIELADYLVPGVTGITFELVSCDSARADYYDTVRVANGKLVLTSNTLGHVHGANTQTETVCTVVGRGRAGSHRREFQLYTVSDRKPLALASNNVSMEAVRATEVDIQITTSGPGNYVRLGWRKTGSRPTFGVASLTNSPATLTISNLEPATNYEIRVYSMTRQAFDLYRGGNSGSAGSLISEISPASKWISNLSGGGLGSSLTLAVTTAAVNPQGNRAPVAVGTIPAQTVDVGSTVPVSLDGYFNDPDNDTLTYTATSLYISRATVSVLDSTLTIAGIDVGIARIAVTATDPSGLTAPQEFIVTVSTREPGSRCCGDHSRPNGGRRVDCPCKSCFSDPDNDTLTYEATSGYISRATVSVSGSTLTINGIATGIARIAVTATDPSGLTAPQEFIVTVNPQGTPVAVGTIPAQTVDVGSTVPVSLDGYFSDPDSDTLTYTATSLYISRATVSVSGSTLTINGIATGIARIAVTATDPSGLTAPQEFIVTVNSVTVNAQGNRSPTSDTSNEQQGSLRVDVNDDGVVDIADMLLVAEQLGVSGPTNADINVDGIVDAQDLLLVANAFGPVDAPQ